MLIIKWFALKHIPNLDVRSHGLMEIKTFWLDTTAFVDKDNT